MAVSKSRSPYDETVVAEVMRLHFVEGLPLRAISRQLQLSRNTVRRILGRRPPKARPGPCKRESILDPYLPQLREWLTDTPELKAPGILERLRPLGYTGGVSILRDCMRRLRPHKDPEAFLKLDFAPGAALQVDWADFGFALPGCPRRVSAFVAALAYSRYLYVEFTVSQAMGTFLRCMERALAFFGGTTTASIYDNMKTVVIEHSPSATRFNWRMLEYARVRGGFGVIACNVRKANEKGRVERPIRFIRERFWPGRRFVDLLDLNRQAVAWRDDLANNREHEDTGRVPSLVFRNEERTLLKPLTATPFDADDVEPTSITKTCRVRFDRNHYSVPWRLVSQSVVVRGNDDWVSVWLGNKQVALHRRCWGIREDRCDKSHERALREFKQRANANSLPPMLVDLEQTGRDYFKIIAAGGRSIHRETVRLTLLVELFGAVETRSAIDEVMATGHVGTEYVEYVLRHKRKLEPSAPPIRLGNPELDDIILPPPDLTPYDRPVRTSDPGTPPDATPDEDHAA